MTVDKSQTRIRRMFGEISARYDLMNHVLSGGTDYYWRWRTVRTVAPSGDTPILDVCTGTGDLALAYWKRVGGRTRVIGADFTHEMLCHATRKAGDAPSQIANGQHPPTFLEGDTLCLPFPENQFQIVSVAFGLRNVGDTERGLREMTRVCRPGGKVAVLEFSIPANRLFRSVYSAYFKYVLPRIGQLLARNRQSAYNYLPESVSEFPHGNALADLMRTSGLTDVRWKPLTFGVAALYWGVKPNTSG